MDRLKSTEKAYADLDREHSESELDHVAINSDQSFPASDAPSWTPVRGIGGRRPNKKKARGQ
jgi:hypothetical protein